MKNTGFKKPTYEEYIQKQKEKQKKQRAALKRSGFKSKPKPKKTKGKKESIKTLRNKCDKLLTPIIKNKIPYCELCGNQTEVAHHHVHKSKSNNLRYYIPNLIGLCHKCHLALHHNESYHASRIVEKRGLEWFRDLEKNKNKIIKVNRDWYYQNLEALQENYGMLK